MELVAFVPVTDVARAHAFYTGVLGLASVELTPWAAVVRSGGTTVRITPVGTFTPQPFTVLGWAVPDITAAVLALKAKGVTFKVYDGFGQDENDIWASPGGAARVAWFTDPDGNVLSLTQFG